jgi:Chromo (CHRromatin Organisation MOdifier) domain
VNRQGTKRKALSSSPNGGQLAKQVHNSVIPQHPVKERDTDAPSSKRRQRKMTKTPPRTLGSGGKANALAYVNGVGRSRDRPPPVNAEDNQYAVERVLACYVRNGGKKYLVRWLGYGEEDDEEVDEDDIEESLKKLSQFSLTEFIPAHRR